MKKQLFIFLLTIVFNLSSYSQILAQDLNMGLYQLQFPSANGGNNRIQSFGGTFPVTWLFKSRFDDIHIDAGENSSNTYKILFKTGGIERGRFNSNGNFGIGTTIPNAKLDVNGNIKVAAPGGNWILGKTGTGGITSSTQLSSVAYHPFLRQTTASGHVINLGGLGDYFGFFGYDKDRTANGYDHI